jgi:hypothetical protein
VNGKLGIAALCFLFAIPFGGVGVFTGWLAGTTIYDGVRARDWVLVKADPINDEAYRYVIDGREYVSERVTLLRAGSSDLDNAGHEMLARSRSEKKALTVFVNPDNPAESVVDRTIPWMFVVGMTPFVFGFGGVGIGALWFLVHSLRESARPSRPRGKRVAVTSDAATGVLGIWVFAFFWNIIAIPVSLLVVPDALRNGEWAVLFVLIFPLIGLLMIWGAVSATIQRLRRGKGEFRIDVGGKRVGEVLAGSVRYPRGVKAGDRLAIRLQCRKTSRDSDGDSRTETHWSKEMEAMVADAGAGARASFRFDVPGNLPARGAGERGTYSWNLEVRPAGKPNALADSIDLEMDEAPDGGGAAAAVAPEPEVPVEPRIAALMQRMGRDPSELTPEQRAQLARLTPGQKAAIGNIVKAGPLLKKVIVAGIVIFVAIQVFGFVAGVVALAMH